MKAFYHRIGGSNVGGTDNGITANYKLLRNMIRFGIPSTPRESYRVEICDERNMYAPPVRTLTVNNE